MRGEKTQIFRTKVPTLNDNGFIVTESRPIATYLSEKYGKDDKLYPKDLGVRSTVDARLYFDIGTFYKAFGDCVVSKTFEKATNSQKVSCCSNFRTSYQTKFVSIMAIWVIKFPREGYKISQIFGQKLDNPYRHNV